MYDHEYEWQILGFLRILKYIWQRNKSILADLVRDYRCGEIDTEDIFELSVMLLVEYICVDYLPEDDPNDFYGEEYTCYLLMESELDDYLTLIAQIELFASEQPNVPGGISFVTRWRCLWGMCCTISKSCRARQGV